MRATLTYLVAALALLPAAVFAAGAEETGTQATSEPVEIGLAHYAYFGDVTEWPDLKEQFVQEIERKYGVRIKMNLIPRNNYLEKLYLMVGSGELKGLIRVFSIADVLKFQQDGAIEPVDEYLKDNAIWQREFIARNNYLFYDGKIWSVPAGYTGLIFGRGWRQDWLDKLGLPLPTTVDQLYEAARAFTENDPDGNGVKDTIGLTSADGTWNLQDIFHAYDAKINNIGSNSVYYEPKTQTWEDSALRPGMVDALTMLNRLYTNGYLDKEFATNAGSHMRDKLVSGKYGSSFYWAHYGLIDWQNGVVKNVPNAKITVTAATTGTRKDMLNQYNVGGFHQVLIKGTPRPKEVVNKFIDVFFGSAEANIMARYGLPGVTYRMEGNKVIQLKDPKTGNLMPTPSLLQDIPAFDISKFPVVADGPAAEQDLSISRWLAVRKLIDDGVAANLLFPVTHITDAPYSETYTTLQTDLTRLFKEMVIKATTGEIPVRDAINAYRTQARNLGAQKALEEANMYLSAALKKTLKSATMY